MVVFSFRIAYLGLDMSQIMSVCLILWKIFRANMQFAGSGSHKTLMCARILEMKRWRAKEREWNGRERMKCSPIWWPFLVFNLSWHFQESNHTPLQLVLCLFIELIVICTKSPKQQPNKTEKKKSIAATHNLSYCVCVLLYRLLTVRTKRPFRQPKTILMSV